MLAAAALAALAVAVAVGAAPARHPGARLVQALAGSPRLRPVGREPGYGIVRSNGVVATLGGAAYLGDEFGQTLSDPVVGAAATPDRRGYWLVASDGGIFTFGDAAFYGSLADSSVGARVVGMAATPDGGGYWLVAANGKVFAFGDASFYGSAAGAPVVGMAATPDGRGYWLASSDGGVFSFGDAAFYGSLGGLALGAPVTGIAATPDGRGYWLVGSDGGVFAFGDAPFDGSLVGLALNGGITALLPAGSGYLLLGSDGGVFAMGGAPFYGSAVDPLHPPLYPAPLSETQPASVAMVWIRPGRQPASSGPVRVAMVGDSNAYLTAFGFSHVEASYGAVITNGAIAGCGLDVPGLTELADWSHPGDALAVPVACGDWAQRVQTVLAADHPDVVVLESGYWESQRWSEGGRWTDLSAAPFAAQEAAQLGELATLVQASGARLMVMTSPCYGDGTPTSLVDTYNDLVRQKAAEVDATVLDLHALLCPADTYTAAVDGVTVRGGDGVHVSFDGTSEVIARAFLPEIVATGRRSM